MKNNTGIENKELGITELDREAMVEGSSQAVITILMALAVLVGVWGIACLFGGIAQSGLMELMRGWVAAVTGM